jgi:hypothetical protein
VYFLEIELDCQFVGGCLMNLCTSSGWLSSRSNPLLLQQYQACRRIALVVVVVVVVPLESSQVATVVGEVVLLVPLVLLPYI